MYIATPPTNTKCHYPQWSKVASMAVSRVGVGVATLNNCFYAVGGHDGRSYLNTVEVHLDESNVLFIKYIL